jgi:hypothetical protein
VSSATSLPVADGDEYADALEASAALRIVGGIYDAMVAHCVIKPRLRRVAPNAVAQCGVGYPAAAATAESSF